MTQCNSQLRKRLTHRLSGTGYRDAARLLGTLSMHIVVVNDLHMLEDVP